MRGHYVYLLDEASVDVEETFEVDGVIWRSQRRAPGVLLTVDAHRRGEALERFTVRWEAAGASVELEVSRAEEGWHWQSSRSVGRAWAERVVTGPYVFPLLRCFQGAAVAAIAAAGTGGLDVVVPDIAQPDDAERLLRPRIDRRIVSRLDDGSCRYIGGSYDDAAICWLRDDDMLERYTWDQPNVGSWDVRLVDQS